MAAADDKERREGRGRLSSIDMLPDEAEPDIVWALEQLRVREMPSKMILGEFNARLADRGIAPVSKSAWGRYSIRKALQFRKLDEVQRISGELVSTLGTDGPDAVTVMVAEMIKLASFQLLEGGDLTSKGIMELSRALSSAVSAQRGSDEYRRSLERRVAAQINDAADRAEAIGREAGLSADRIAQLRRDFLGIRPKASEPAGAPEA
ncbi:MAG: DUF3486 family protein [Sphingopyxis sp.]|uniref:phage protein Gp27 family protein n=1 Tax=Sphingopyxis sp. TaxID=1908224 RepID=UPI003D811D47